MLVTLSGMLIEDNAVQSLNVSSPTNLSPSLSVTDVKDVQPEKASLSLEPLNPIRVRVDGNETVVRLVQLENAHLPISLSPSWNVTEVNDVQSKNVYPPKTETVPGISISSRDEQF